MSFYVPLARAYLYCPSEAILWGTGKQQMITERAVITNAIKYDKTVYEWDLMNKLLAGS